MPTPAARSTTRDIVKGYEVSKGEYIEVEPEELEAVEIDSKRVIEIEQFVPKDEIDELYINNPYYIVPDGEVGQQAFAVIREAIRKEGMVALGEGGLHVARARHRARSARQGHDGGHAALSLRGPQRRGLFRRHRERAGAEGHARPGHAHRRDQEGQIRAGQIRGSVTRTRSRISSRRSRRARRSKLRRSARHRMSSTSWMRCARA